MIPDDLHYTAEHEWVRDLGDGRVRIGITHYAQEALGDVVYVSLPEVGATVDAGQSFGEVESTKSVSEIYAPVAGEVVARNDALESRSELVNSDPYGEGWIVELAVGDGGLGGLLDAAAYEKLTATE
ncbi:MAG: glycine cleavage system protein GcvH [Frankiaceae bacterium]|nr:glycine cleavage system protein GcvH [Frankiaceae bacterium]MBV9369651.1 glycine cleavage system protein GcvH [Frankiales bacterium]